MRKMRTRKKLAPIYMMFIFFLSTFVCAQHLVTVIKPLPYIKGATVSAIVSYEPILQAFTYAYKVANSIKSVGSIDYFEFDTSTPQGAMQLTLNGLRDYIGADERWLDYSRRELGTSVVPQVFVSSGGWDPFISGWMFSLRGRGDLSPGQSIGNLVIRSPGLVGVRSFFVKPSYLAEEYLSWAKIPDSLPEGEYWKASNQVEKEVANIGYSLRFTGYTLGPTALPQNCNSACMVQFVGDEEMQAAGLGWIDDHGVANALNAKLYEAKVKLESAESHPLVNAMHSWLAKMKLATDYKQIAINILRSFLLDLDAQHKRNAQDTSRHVTDNAYYLLQPNTQYILTKLGVTSFP